MDLIIIIINRDLMATKIQVVVFWVMATLSGRWLPIFDGMLVNGATTQYSNLHMECS